MIRGIFVGRRISIKFPNSGEKKSKDILKSVYSESDTWSNFKFLEKEGKHRIQYVLWDTLGRELPDGGLYEVTGITRVKPSWYLDKIININLTVTGNILENTTENRKQTNYRLGVTPNANINIAVLEEQENTSDTERDNFDYLNNDEQIDLENIKKVTESFSDKN